MGDSDTDTPTVANTTNNDDTTPLADRKEISNIFQEPTSEQEALLAVFDLDTSHIRTYIAVVEKPNSKVNAIAEILDRHRRYVGKSLRTLYESGFVRRERVTFDTGGYGYVYRPMPPETIRFLFYDKLQEWMINAQSELGRVDRRIEIDTNSICDSQKRDFK